MRKTTPTPAKAAPPSTLKAFLDRCDMLGRATARTRTAVSFSIFNDGSRLDEIHNGGDIGVRRMARAQERLCELEREAKVR